MEIRDNVRRRRKARMMELLEREPEMFDRAEGAARQERPAANPQQPNDRPQQPGGRPQQLLRAARQIDGRAEADPEVWWKQQQSRLHRSGTPSPWQGAERLGSEPPPVNSDTGRSYGRKLLAGLALRALVAAILYGAVWLSFQTEAPGSRSVRAWTSDAVTRDMDFQAAEAWYARYFGGSPSFLPVFRGRKEEPLAVSGSWNRSEAMRPTDGRVVSTFAQDGAGVRIAAAAGSEVKAANAGRIIQVTTDEDGRSSIVIQHAGQMITEYSNVADPAVRADDWVLAGQRIGVIPEPKDAGGQSLLLFAVKRSGGYIDPAEVVPFD